MVFTVHAPGKIKTMVSISHTVESLTHVDENTASVALLHNKAVQVEPAVAPDLVLLVFSQALRLPYIMVHATEGTSSSPAIPPSPPLSPSGGVGDGPSNDQEWERRECSAMAVLHPVFQCHEKIPAGEILFLIDCCSYMGDRMAMARDAVLVFLARLRCLSNTTPFNVYGYEDDFHCTNVFDENTACSDDALTDAATYVQSLRPSLTSRPLMHDPLSRLYWPPVSHGLRQIVFITGGKPSEGLSLALGNLRRTSRNKLRLFIVALGDGCDLPLLEELACNGGGVLEHVTVHSEIVGAVSRHVRRIAHPNLSDVTVEWAPACTALTPSQGCHRWPVFSDDKLVICNKLRLGDLPNSDMRVTIRASGIGGPYTYTAVIPRPAVTEGSDLLFVAALLAKCRDLEYGVGDAPPVKELEAAAAQLRVLWCGSGAVRLSEGVIGADGAVRIALAVRFVTRCDTQAQGVQQVNSKKPSGMKKLYTRDFLASFREQCTNKPEGLPIQLERLLYDTGKRGGGSSSSGALRDSGGATGRQHSWDGGKRPINSPGSPELPQSPGEERWTRPSVATNTREAAQASLNKITGILNKLTLENFDVLLPELLDVDVCNYEILQAAVKLVFNKAINEVKYTAMYAILARELAVVYPHFTINGERQSFARLLLNRSHAEFSLRPDFGGSDEEYADRLKRRILGTAGFVGELFKAGLIPRSLIVECCTSLLRPSAEEFDLELLFKLVKTSGKLLECKDPAFEVVFAQITRASTEPALSPRIRFAMLELVDLRANGWRPRDVDSKQMSPKELEEQQKLASLRTSRFSRRQFARVGDQQPQHQPPQSPQSPRPHRPLAVGPAGASPSGGRYGSGYSGVGGSSHRRIHSEQGGPTSPPVHRSFDDYDRSAGRRGSPAQAQPTRHLVPSASTPSLPLPLPPAALKLAPTAAAAPAPAAAPAASADAEPLSEVMLARVNMLAEEYLESLDDENAAQCAAELGCAEAQLRQVVRRTVELALERGKAAEQDALADLLCKLCIRNAVPQDQLCLGYDDVLANLDDLEVDCPRAGATVARMLGREVAGGCVPLAHLCGLAAQSPQTQPLLRDVAANALTAVLAEKGMEELVSMCQSGSFNPGVFFPSSSAAHVQEFWTARGLACVLLPSPSS
eukprot:TRINITY_DN617_c0_g2_i5.p1 TRINITY_DN617_c0_g2~~TRINITY_DN617_c0_g2_i5.p1  ORF type:complete len:1311 (-),score=324.30 TRINITY_DN617_c0_g2_i5:3768-7202(-)